MVLVSSIAQFDAINTRNNAVYSNMMASNAVMSAIDGMRSFGSEQNLAFLHSLDNRFSLEILKNNLMYKLACIQESVYSKMQAKEFEQSKKSVNYLA